MVLVKIDGFSYDFGYNLGIELNIKMWDWLVLYS